MMNCVEFRQVMLDFLDNAYNEELKSAKTVKDKNAELYFNGRADSYIHCKRFMNSLYVQEWAHLYEKE
jgi:hypothetical protein